MSRTILSMWMGSKGTSSQWFHLMTRRPYWQLSLPFKNRTVTGRHCIYYAETETPEREKGEVASMPANEKLLNTIFRGEVASVVNFGAFVSIPGTKNQGLIHKSQISNAPVDDANDVLQRGESVWCKVINFTADGKIGLSMKVVNQGSGQDLDPNGVQIQQDEKKRQAYNPRQGNRKIQLEAVFNTTCSKCGCKGHLARECFKPSDGKSYVLLSDDEDDSEKKPNSSEAVPTPQELLAQVLTKKKSKKEKKEKKKKKSKKSKRKRKKEKKEKKSRKKRKRRETSSSSSSSSSSSDSSSSEESSSSSSSSEDEKSRPKIIKPRTQIISPEIKKIVPESQRRVHSPSPRHREPSKHYEAREPPKHYARHDDEGGDYRNRHSRGSYEPHRAPKRYHSRSLSPSNRYHKPEKRHRY